MLKMILCSRKEVKTAGAIPFIQPLGTAAKIALYIAY
jgi:hypothetical protein